MFKSKLSLPLLRSIISLSSRTVVNQSWTNEISVPDCSISQLFFQNHEKYSSNIALIDSVTDDSWRYSEVVNAISRGSSALYKNGLNKSDVVSIISLNSPETVIAHHAVMSTGASLTYANPNSTEYELKHHFNLSRPRIIFTMKDFLEKVTQSIAEFKCCEKIYLLDKYSPTETSSLQTIHNLLDDKGDESCLFRKDIIIDSKSHVAQMPQSSGTTGLPKMVMLTHRNMCASTLQIQKTLEICTSDIFLGYLPLFHIAGFLGQASAFPFGGKLVIVPKFDPFLFLKTVEKYKITFGCAVPPVVQFLLQHPAVEQHDLSSIERILCSAAPISPSTEHAFIEKFKSINPNIDIYQAYGQTETTGIIHVSPKKVHRLPNKLGTVGFLSPGMEYKLIDPATGEEVTEPYKLGEVWARGPNVMLGYYKNESGTKNTITEDGWLKTGDLLHFDSDGYHYCQDRLKELIKFKAFQVAPAELEGVLLTHSKVADVAVIGRPDDKYGEAPMAFIIKKDQSLTEDEIKQFLSEKLSDYKQLRGGVVFVDEIPKTPSGKILRRILREKIK